MKSIDMFENNFHSNEFKKFFFSKLIEAKYTSNEEEYVKRAIEYSKLIFLCIEKLDMKLYTLNSVKLCFFDNEKLFELLNKLNNRGELEKIISAFENFDYISELCKMICEKNKNKYKRAYLEQKYSQVFLMMVFKKIEN